MEAINGVTCIKGEIHSIITFMRLNTRWSQAYRYQTDSQDEGELIHSFRELNEYLEGTFDLHDVDCVTYLTPFLKVITSDKASGPLTSAALSSLCKFVMYGFMSTKFPRMNEGMAIIADCVSQCVFEETDWESDELILMKLLELSTLTYRCDASCLLTVSAAWDIYSTCMSIQNHYRATKILRSEAETTLIHLSLTIYSRAYHILSDPSDGARQFLSQQEVASGKANWDGILVNYNLETPFGITLLLCKIMIILSELIDLHTQPLEGVKFSMQLINVALEAGGLALGAVDPLVDILRNQVCRHLLRASQSENLAIFSLALRVVFNLFMSIKDHMKVQLEVIFSSVHLRLLVNEKSVKPGNSLSPAKEELALESLLEFCREPSLMLDLYTNYDCDVQCTNLFDSVISALCFRSIPHKQKIVSNSNSSLQTLDPVSKVDKLSVINKLALDGLLAIVHSVAVKCLLVDGGRATASDLSTESASVLTGLIQASSQCSSSNSSVGEIDSKEVEDFIDIHKSSKQKKTIHEQNDVSVTTPVKTGFVLDEQVDQWCENDSVDDELYQVSQDQEYDIYSNLVFDSISQSPMASQEKEMEVVKKTGNSNLSKKNSKKMERTIDHTRSSSFTSNSSSGTPNSHLADVVRSESLEERISRAQVFSPIFSTHLSV